jgi:signal transduction histidine kinase
MPTKPHHMSFIARHLPAAAATFAVVGGIVSMAGWIGGIDRLLSWSNNDIRIKFNTAICITFVAISLFVSALWPRQKFAIRLFGGVGALIAAATLLQHLTGVDLGIDTLIFDEPPNAAATAAPGRMGIPASVSLTSLGLALIFATIARTRRAAAMLAIVSLCIAALSLAGYLFGADQLYSLPRFTGIALQTATMIAVLALGIAALMRDQGLAATFVRADAGGTMFRRLALPVMMISLVLGSLRLFAQNAGYFDAAFGTAARTLAEIVLLLGLLWWTAESLSRSESRSRDTSNVKAENETLRRIAIAQEAERRRIARDVHDHIGQSLTALRLRLDSLQKTVGESGEFSDEMSRTCDQAKKLDADVSLLVWQMRPGVLDTHGLASALNSFVREWSLNHGIDAEFHATSPNRRLPPEIETNLYRIIQEALNNILKHANASKVSITMNYLPDEAILVIEDNGAGFDTEADRIHTTEGSGFGLIGMRERAVLVGGRLEIESVPGGGTAILVRVPRSASMRTPAASNGSRG